MNDERLCFCSRDVLLLSSLASDRFPTVQGLALCPKRLASVDSITGSLAGRLPGESGQ